MHGPYTAHVYFDQRTRAGEPDLILSYEDVEDYDAAVAGRFYRSGGGATKLGTLRAACFAVADLLGPGDEARLELRGFEGSEPAPAGEGELLQRNEAGELRMTLGSRWGQPRHFRGI